MGDLQSPALPLGHGAVRRSIFCAVSTLNRWLCVVASAVVVLLLPVPSGITPESWRLLAFFTATIVGSIVRPVPAGAVVFLGVSTIAITNTLAPAKALA